MTKKWSSTKSGDGLTKRAAAKKRRAMARKIKTLPLEVLNDICMGRRPLPNI
jgi:hypothetical protein